MIDPNPLILSRSDGIHSRGVVNLKNETVLKFKELYKLLKQNNDMLPDEVWEKLINVKQG